MNWFDKNILMKKLTYISLFSSAGVGCYGFKSNGFECIATNEISERRLAIQKHNNKCKYDTGYITGDITFPENQQKIFDEIERWQKKERLKTVDVVIATPPCQGMSVANHKKKNEQKQNSLIVESIKIVLSIEPKYFIFENVRTFLNTICTNIDGKNIKINDAINEHLAGKYNILKRVINFKEYGANSSRTRTLVIGIRKDIKDITPYDIFPAKEPEKLLCDTIGDYPKLDIMGDINNNDIYHHYKKYPEHMIAWIKDIKEGQSAFDNPNIKNRPHKIIDDKIVLNKNKNGDKYKRCEWDRVAPCIHTRNDILSSQSTIHPTDNRVFSIRELMDIMNIPHDFKWVKEDFTFLNNMPSEYKNSFLKKEAMNIRQSIGEAVPTIIFSKIAKNILFFESAKTKRQDIENTIKKESLTSSNDLLSYINLYKNTKAYSFLSKIIETSNANRNHHAAFYTPQNICYRIVNSLPDFKNDTIRILEPSVGIGNFLPLLANRYDDKKLIIDIIDIDKNILQYLKELDFEASFDNIKLNYICADFLKTSNQKANPFYDLVIGNPPFGKVSCKNSLRDYRNVSFNATTSNYCSFFLEKALTLANFVAMIMPKSFLSAPEFNLTRELVQKNHTLKNIIDFGEKGFEGVKIETVSLLIKKNKTDNTFPINIDSYITNSIFNINNINLFDKDFNSWLLYKNDFFNNVKNTMYFSIFNSYRDRQITKKHTSDKGKFRVLKSRNIKNNEIIDIDDYDCFVNNLDEYSVGKFANTDSILIPNLSYNPRACFLPENSIADGSVAILQAKNGYMITEKDLAYYATEEFNHFYRIGRNLGTRSLNIDSNSINLWGIKKEYHKHEH